MGADLTTYARKLAEFFPPEKDQLRLREHLTIQDRVCCWHCGLPKENSDLLRDVTLPVCRTCVPEICKKLDAMQLVLAGTTNFDTELAKLKQNSSPEFINEADKMRQYLQGKGVSLGEETARLMMEATGANLSPAEKEHFTPDTKVASKMMVAMWNIMKERDGLLSNSNRYDGVTEEDLRGVATQTVVDEMIVSRAFRRQMIQTLNDRVPGFLDDVIAVAKGEYIEEPLKLETQIA